MNEVNEIDEFDLFEYQKFAREQNCAEELFNLWDRVSSFYERGEISSHELSEMKAVIWPRLRSISALRKIINGMAQAS